jgi:hypothetical protein
MRRRRPSVWLLCLDLSFTFFTTHQVKEICTSHTKNSLQLETIRVAVQLWFSDPDQGIAKYGRIEEWNTSEVTDMSKLFRGQEDFIMTSVGGMCRKWWICAICSIELHSSTRI